MTRAEIVALINEYDEDRHELWCRKKNNPLAKWRVSYVSDPLDLSISDRTDFHYELREKRRELGQWIFDGAPEWVDFACKNGNGEWWRYGQRADACTRRAPMEWYTGYERMDPQPTGLDHIDWKDSKIRRAT